MLSQVEKERAESIFELLKEATTQQVVKDFLRDKGVHHSAANWEHMYDTRVLPALESKKLALSDLEALLRDVEEHGRQHIFLFQCKPEDATKILLEHRLTQIAIAEGLDNLLAQPTYVNMPVEPEIVDIRINRAPNGSGIVLGLTIKIVECRESSKLVDDDFDQNTGRRTKVWEVTKKRAVSVAHLSNEGLLEIRVASRENSTKYHEQVSKLIRLINKFIPMDSFEPVSLGKSKATLHEKKDDFAGVIRYTSTTATNDMGISMNLSAANMSNNLMQNDGSAGAMREFLAKKGYVTGSNIWFIMPDDATREIHVILNGEVHEFAVTAACTPRDYSYVLGKILSLN
ncbi:hypothetical protein [Pseudomonas sp. Root562]|uniref:hypothetical protein n=1 Tax=Pseudomonas sp. Root562 TaxID=1736561 RepID=UPI000702B6E3|nr:hypothetical protein [Pseudomonas sp. Root562]KQZ94577.1 hypothetical protein ASD60_00840 [Pseudomonas sp. Root562]